MDILRDTQNPGGTIKQVDQLHELTLDDFIIWQVAEEQIQDLNYKIEDLEIRVEVEEVDEEDAEILETEYNITKYDRILDQLRITTPEEDHHKLIDLPRLDLLGLKTASGMDYVEYEKGTIIEIPGANDQQIADLKEHLEQDIPKTDKIRRAKVQLRIDKLKKNQFILLPVADAIFAAKARTDMIRKQLPQLPEEVTRERNKEKDEKYRESLKLYIEKLDKELAAKELDRTQNEVRERLKLRKNIRRWQNETETKVYQLADQFLTHFLLPLDEEYSSRYAEARREHIRKLTMDKVLPFINFILAVLKT